MYPSEDVEVSTDQPQSFIIIEQCRKELSRLEGKLSPVMGGGLEKPSTQGPVLNELDGRLQDVLTHIRDIVRRVKL
jgi:hypothetical protein